MGIPVSDMSHGDLHNTTGWGGVKTLAAWGVLGLDFGGPPMEAILNCGVPITLITVQDTSSNLKAKGFDSPK